MDIRLKDSSSFRLATGLDISFENYYRDDVTITCGSAGCLKGWAKYHYDKLFLPLRIKHRRELKNKMVLDYKFQLLTGMVVGSRFESDTYGNAGFGNSSNRLYLSYAVEIRLGPEIELHLNKHVSLYTGASWLTFATLHIWNPYMNMRTGMRITMTDK